MSFFATPTGRKTLFGALYLSEGAPIGFIWWALPTQLRASGVPISDITELTALLVLPWVFKFLWAPLVDTVRARHWNRISWIVAMQIIMGLSLLPLAFFEFQVKYTLLVPLLFVHAIAAATQDASIDALSISVVPSSERGAINGWMQTGMLGGRALFGGGALLLANQMGITTVIVLLIAVVWCSLTLLLSARHVLAPLAVPLDFKDRWRDFWQQLQDIARRQVTWVGLLFAVVGGVGFEGIGAVAGPFLVDSGCSLTFVGTFFGLPVVAAMSSGALIGGYTSDRYGRTRMVAIFLVSVAITVLSIAAYNVCAAAIRQSELVALFSLLYLFVGMFTAASYALFMDLTRRELGATQFSAYMGATNGCEAWSGYAIGRLIPVYGYSIAFTILALLSLMTLPLLRSLRRT